MKITKLQTSTISESEEKYEQFVCELGKICNRFGVALRCIGGIQPFDRAMQFVTYSRDFSGGDLEPRVEPKTRRRPTQASE
jgi:hypothetical protein